MDTAGALACFQSLDSCDSSEQHKVSQLNNRSIFNAAVPLASNTDEESVAASQAKDLPHRDTNPAIEPIIVLSLPGSY